ncbi:glycerol-3-phosphate 1-O-acyltransferase PlsY [Desulfohalovibrio reitneri]|uniref:glycerol-3-phosphate 1-O-acyltransferase PlsY n=1 Tax=Desulfohalovibrio reitneri TaxID=1307759 RepID=UPI0004A72810|nr:glycerol-3-phosphate 1-O-acyltransferase PlsY [Desulfohalovibrio reitneri]
MFLTLGWLALTYFIGSIPFGLFISRIVCGVDPRTAGSRNTGATNVARLCGTRYGVAVLALDLLKGLLPVWAATTFSDNWVFLSLCALAAIVGHMHSCFLGLSGGKGFATSIGAFLALAFGQTLFAVILTLLTIKVTGYVSMGALFFGAAMPVLLLLTAEWGFILAALAMAVLLYWKHSENIGRLARGEEKSWKKS